MICAKIDQFRVMDSEVAGLIQQGACSAAVERAREGLRGEQGRLARAGSGEDPLRVRAAIARRLCDLAAALMSSGEIAVALTTLQEAVNVGPLSESVFHNLVTGLHVSRRLRGRNHEMVCGLIARHSGKVEWIRRYRALLLMPMFLNVEVVSGKCNLRCRMCLGVNRRSYPNKLRWIEAGAFAGMLDGAPTARGVTLSASDSDPLLHPELEAILGAAASREVVLNLYTNGLALGARKREGIVSCGVVSAVNFSVDAATAETYRRIRGGDFERVIRNIGALEDARQREQKRWPLISLSFVAMKDNIEELPAFVELGAELGVRRVFVEDLVGWRGASGGNYPATDHGRCFDYVQAARVAAERAGVFLLLPERLKRRRWIDGEERGDVSGEDDAGETQAGAEAHGDVVHQGDLGESGDDASQEPLAHCGWLNGVWVRGDGSLHPCCLVQSVADMGKVTDGPLHCNEKYVRVKTLLAQGKVFRACRQQRMCAYVQQQKAAGIPLRLITKKELGEARPELAAGLAAG